MKEFWNIVQPHASKLIPLRAILEHTGSTTSADGECCIPSYIVHSRTYVQSFSSVDLSEAARFTTVLLSTSASIDCSTVLICASPYRYWSCVSVNTAIAIDLQAAVKVSVQVFRVTIFMLVLYCFGSKAYQNNTDYNRQACQSAGVADTVLNFIQKANTTQYNVPDMLTYINVGEIVHECNVVVAPIVVTCVAVALAIAQSQYVVALRDQCKTPEGHLAVLQTSEVCVIANIVHNMH
jgi:hypothetical protein